MSKVLVVAYYTPPLGMSGVMRVTKLVKFLPRFGWEPVVLTVRKIAYYHYDEGLLNDWRGIKVWRARSLDPARLRHLLAPGRPVSGAGSGRAAWLANVLCFPDAKSGWYPFALGLGEKVIREEKPDAIFATAPPFTALSVGAALKRFSGLPLVSDFRDPWPMGFIPPPGWLAARTRRFRSGILRASDAVLAVNQGTASHLEGRAVLLENGFDPDEMAAPARKLEGLSVIYVGNVWENEPEFRAVVQAAGAIPNLKVRLVGGLSARLGQELASYRAFEHLGRLGHAETLAVMKGADILLYVSKPNQAAGIKLYEYLGAKRPILSVCRERSESEELVERHDAGLVSGPDRAEVSAALDVLLRGSRRFSFSDVERYSRLSQAQRLAELLSQLSAATLTRGPG